MSGNPAKRGWDPITVGPANPMNPMARAFHATDGAEHHYAYRTPLRAIEIRAFGNRLYDGAVLTFEDGSMHLSFKRKDRSAIRDWRHFQAIKNEVAGPEREAIEIFPAESELMDAANEYHLWVLPANMQSPLGLTGRGLLDATDNMDHAAYRQGGPPGARQRGWEPGIPTGLGRSE
jgi:hypothetical protein